MQFLCPNCSASIRCRDEIAGRKARCPTCKHKFRVPLPSSATSDDSGVVENSPQETDVTVAEFDSESQTAYAPATRPVPKVADQFNFTEENSREVEMSPIERNSGKRAIFFAASFFGSMTIIVAVVAIGTIVYLSDQGARRKTVAKASANQAEKEKAILQAVEERIDKSERREKELEDANAKQTAHQAAEQPAEQQKFDAMVAEQKAKEEDKQRKEDERARRVGALTKAERNRAIRILDLIKARGSLSIRNFTPSDIDNAALIDPAAVEKARRDIREDRDRQAALPPTLASRITSLDRQAVVLLSKGELDAGLKKLHEARELPFEFAQSTPQDAKAMAMIYVRIMALVGNQLPAKTKKDYLDMARSCAVRGGVNPLQYDQWFLLIANDTVKHANNVVK